MDSKKCLVCGHEFFKPKSTSRKKWATAKYCSVGCSIQKTSIALSDKRYSVPIGSTPWNKGAKYDEEMKSRLNLSGLAVGHGFNLGKKFPQRSGENHSRWKPPIEKLCAYCGKTLFLKPNQLRSRNFCNRQCWSLGTRGTGSPVYKGEKAVGRYRNRVAELPEYQAWRMAVLKRDHWTCQICHHRDNGKDRVPKVVDHIKRFYFIVMENNLKTIEDACNCAELWDITNGRCICRPCDRKSNTYGTTGLRKRA